MTCESFQAQIDEWLDGELAPTEAQLLEQHIEHCHACQTEAQLAQDMLHALQSMPLVAAPSDAWSQLQEQLQQEKTQQTTSPSLFSQVVEWCLQPWVGWSIAAAAIVTLVLQQPHTPQERPILPHNRTAPTIPTQLRQVTTRSQPGKQTARRATRKKTQQKQLQVALTHLRQAQTHYQTALRTLEQIAQRTWEKQPFLQPHQKAVKVRWTQLDQQIGSLKRKLQNQPNSPRLHQHLLTLYQQKVELLRHATIEEL